MKNELLNINDIMPLGWVKKQLEIQSLGLSGNLDIVWPDVANSQWFGGNKDGWERVPYFLDGYIPLAYLTKDEEKIKKVHKYINYIISGQDECGIIKPLSMSLQDSKNMDRWSTFLILKVLVMYADFSSDERIEEVVDKALKHLYQSICNNTLRNWAAARWGECYIPILWLYKKRPQKYLIDLAYRLKAQGINYKQASNLWQSPLKEWTYETHVVNIAMAIKFDAIYSELMNVSYTNEAEELLKVLDEKHGTAYGHFNGDECLSGFSPIQGSELCGIVEAMYSYEWLIKVTGDNKWADRLEMLCFNGLFATISEDMWAHQYDQQVNQISCKKYEKSIFATNGVESNMFGLEPHYGCCTANFGQGFPKFCYSAVMKDEEGFVIVSPIPIQVSQTINNKKVTLTINGEYPFRKKISLIVNNDVKVKLHIPNNSKISCNIDFIIQEGWAILHMKANEKVEVSFDLQVALCDRPNNHKCVRYGNLLFALPISYKKQSYEYERDGVKRKKPYCDYSFTPTSNWQYAFASTNFTVEECEFDNAFSRKNPPIKIKATLAPVKWDFETGYEDIASSIAGDIRVGDNIEKYLYPYGATYLRITEMKLIE